MQPTADSSCSLPPRITNLLFQFLGAGHHFNLLLSAHESAVVFIFRVGAAKDRLSLVRLHLILKALVVSIVVASLWVVELRCVPLFERTDQLLFDSVNLALSLCVVDLAVF